MSTLMPVLPTRTFDRMNQMMEAMFGLPNNELTPWVPPEDIWETETEFFFLMELPGFRLEDVHLELAGDVLNLWGKREYFESKEWNYLRRERKFGEFRRSFKLDAAVRPELVHAEFKDGLLSITVPKIEPVKPHKVKIKT